MDYERENHVGATYPRWCRRSVVWSARSIRHCIKKNWGSNPPFFYKKKRENVILELFTPLMAIGLILIIIGLFRPNESAQSLIGFTILFVLSIVIIGNGLEYRDGATIITSGSTSTVTYTTAVYNDTTTHRIGWVLAVASAVGFAGVLYSLRRGSL